MLFYYHKPNSGKKGEEINGKSKNKIFICYFNISFLYDFLVCFNPLLSEYLLLLLSPTQLVSVVYLISLVPIFSLVSQTEPPLVITEFTTLHLFSVGHHPSLLS